VAISEHAAASHLAEGPRRGAGLVVKAIVDLESRHEGSP
jgi:hypothetical protein